MSALPPTGSRRVAVIDVGGTNLRTAIIDDAGHMREHAVHATDWSERGAGVVRQCLDSARAAVERDPGVAAVGVAATGVFSLDGRVLGARPGREAWQGVDLAARIAAAVGRPARAANDGQLMALGEHRFGRAHRRARVLLGVSLGTGLGGGLVIDGSLYRGAFGAAGEIGHVSVASGGRPCHCGRAGCVESYVSGPALASRYAEATGRGITPSEVCDRAERGEPEAQALLDQVVVELGSALASVLALADADALVLGGGLGLRLAPRLPALRQALSRPRLVGREPQLTAAALGASAPLFGAAALALDAVGAAQ